MIILNAAVGVFPKCGIRCMVAAMKTFHPSQTVHPEGEPLRLSSVPLSVDTYGGRIHVEWDPQAAVTLPGPVTFFYRILEDVGVVCALGARLSVDVPQSQCATEDRCPRDTFLVNIVGTPSVKEPLLLNETRHATGQQVCDFVESIKPGRVYEYVVLVTTLSDELFTLNPAVGIGVR